MEILDIRKGGKHEALSEEILPLFGDKRLKQKEKIIFVGIMPDSEVEARVKENYSHLVPKYMLIKADPRRTTEGNARVVLIHKERMRPILDAH